MITQKELKEILHYDPETGIFTRKSKPTYNAKIGDPVGSVDHGYLRINVIGKRYYAHRLAWLYMYGEWPNIIDHIDANKENNRIGNLRNVDFSGNMMNGRISRCNKTGIVGVAWDKFRKKWRVEISANLKANNLGRYDDFFEACCVRRSAENRLGFHPNHGKQ